MGTNEIAGILAALERASQVPPGPTLVDQISEQDWLDEDAGSWNINVGATNPA
jgi:hypothetical protein